MVDDQNERPKVARFPEPLVGAAREAEERRRAAKIARDIEEVFGRVAAEDARLKTEEAACKATDGKPNSGAKVREQAERAAASLTQEPARSQELEQQLAARQDEQTLLAQERPRSQELEQQLATRQDEQTLLAQERARSQELEQQLATRQDDQKLLAQERARSQELEQQLAARQDDQKLLAQERTRSQELEQQLAARQDDQKLLVQERARSQAIEQQLGARGDELVQERARSQALERQLAAREDEQKKLLAQERARSHAFERQLAARVDEQKKLLAQERARSQAVERQLAVRGDATPDRGRSTTASPSDRPASMPAAPDAPGNLEAARLIAQARLLLEQGKIIAARSVLERAAESGSALALFLLAETYDRAILSAWGIFGRRGSVTKARELYAKAVAGGVHEAKHRLSALR
jgi:hypothetical protein